MNHPEPTPDHCYDVNIVGFDSQKVDDLVSELCRQIDGCTTEIAEHMLLHLPANVAHGVSPEEALLMWVVFEGAGAEIAIPRKEGWPDRTLM